MNDAMRSLALTYAAHDIAVFPVKADKTPRVSQYEATTDPDVITDWWVRWPDDGVAHRVATHHVILDIDPRHNGHATWAALRDAIGGWPVTRAHASGRGDGGGHVWWLRPDDKLSVKALDEWARAHGVGHAVTLPDGTVTDRWTSGIDLLHHDHRYSILPGSIHAATGKPYTWVDGRGLDCPVAPMPPLLADLLSSVPIIDTRPPKPVDPTSIADWFSANTPWTQILRPLGWTVVAGDGDHDGSRWRHPVATSAFSATIRHGCLFVYTPNTPFEVTAPGDPRGYTPFRAWALLEHRDDQSAAARAARELKDGPQAPRPSAATTGLLTSVTTTAGHIMAPQSMVNEGAAGRAELHDDLLALGASWERTKLADLVAGIKAGTHHRPKPTVGRFHNGDGALYYTGRVNGLYGEPGKGKTMIALAVAAQVLADGGAVAWIDLEEPVDGILGRLLALGADPDHVVARFAHYAPEEPMRNAVALDAELAELDPDLVVIDSTGEALAVEGWKPNNDDEVANWFRTWPRHIATRTGAAVIVIDHVVKDETTRGLWPGGSQRKKAAINGAAFMATPIKELGRDVEGRLKLTTSKDRHGYHRAGAAAAEFVLNGTTTPETWRFVKAAERAEGEEFRPTGLMEKISRYLEDVGEPVTTNAIRTAVKGNHDAREKGLRMLVRDGYVRFSEDGQRRLYGHVKRYSETDETLGLTDTGPTSPNQPQASPRASTEPTGPTSPTPFLGGWLDGAGQPHLLDDPTGPNHGKAA